MGFQLQILSASGKPLKDKQVLVHFRDSGKQTEWRRSDANGLTDFSDYDPGIGHVYVDGHANGKSVMVGVLEGKKIVKV